MSLKAPIHVNSSEVIQVQHFLGQRRIPHECRLAGDNRYRIDMEFEENQMPDIALEISRFLNKLRNR